MNQKRKNNKITSNTELFSKGYKWIKPLQKKSGFTLIELMIVVAIGLILTSLGIASMNILIPRIQTKSIANDLKSNLQLTKLEAIKRNRPLLVDFTDSAGPLIPGGDCITCIDTNGDNDCGDEVGTNIITQLNLTNSNHVAFQNAGFAFGNSFFTFNPRGIPSSPGGVNINCTTDIAYLKSLALAISGRLSIN